MASMKKIAVIGVGEQAWTNLVPSLATIPNVRIDWVCDTDPVARSRAAEKLKAVQFGSVEELLGAVTPDALIVASTPTVHQRVLEMAIPRGIPTFVEKPPTLTTSGLQQLLRLNRTSGTPTRVGLNFSYSEPVQIALQAMQDAAFGNLAYMRINHLNNKPDQPLWLQNNHRRDFLLSQVIHALGVVFEAGAPASDDEHFTAYDSQVGVLMSLNKQFVSRRSGNPFTFELVASSSAPFFDWSLQAISDNGSMITINSLLEIEISTQGVTHPLGVGPKWWRSSWRPSPVSTGHRRNGFTLQFESFLNDKTSHAQMAPNLAACLPMYELMDRMEAANVLEAA